ncbi:hypothetical protein ACFVJ5_04380 [Nocardia sp. NPDC127606]|uniref:hypothetical protein n=1 Tax=Nocardia sp. NPDC127606 TaxID=3345406 RepID=UPI003636AD7C
MFDDSLATIWSGLCATAGLTGTVLLMIGLRVGVTERLVFYPLPAWMAVTGTAIVLTTVRTAMPWRRALRWIGRPRYVTFGEGR